MLLRSRSCIDKNQLSGQLFVFTEIIAQKHEHPLLNQPSGLESRDEFIAQRSKEMVHLREYIFMNSHLPPWIIGSHARPHN
jgi:hypothetical protein